MQQPTTKANTATTIDKGWARLLRSVCKQYMINTDNLFPLNLNHQDRHELVTIRKILVGLFTQTNDYNLVIHAAKQVTPLTFNSYSLTLWSSPSLDILLKNMGEYSIACGIPIKLRYHKTVLGDVELWVINNEPLNKESHVTQLGVTLFMATMVEIIHNAIDEESLGIDVKLINHNYPVKALESFERLINITLSFGHPIRKICIHKKHLHKKIPSADTDIYFASLKLLRQKVEKLNSDNIILQIYNTLNQLPTLENTSGEFIAQRLNMSVRTVNRRLTELDTSYRGVIEKYKLEKALYLIDKGNINLTEIAYQLGFSDLSTFSRAFKRWTGTSPSKINLTSKI